MRLSELAPRVGFPLVALRPGIWRGASFVGDVRAIGDEIRALQLVYLTRTGDAGLLVSHLAPEPAPDRDDPMRLDEHLTGFVSRFEPAFLSARARRGKYVPFPPGERTSTDEHAAVCGQRTLVRIVTSKRLPLQAARMALVRHGAAVDLCVAAWNQSVHERLESLEPLGVEAMRAFDDDDHAR